MTQKKNNITDEVVLELQEEMKEKRAEALRKEKEKSQKKAGKGLEAKLNKLEQENETLKTELDTLKNDYLKVLADSENTKKRLRLDFEMHNKYRLQSFALELLPALDNLERALANTPEDDPIYLGVKMIYDQIISSLKKEGVEEIPAEGAVFDPNVHHAIAVESKEGIASGEVIEVLQKGYKIKDRVLRATLVKVSE